MEKERDLFHREIEEKINLRPLLKTYSEVEEAKQHFKPIIQNGAWSYCIRVAIRPSNHNDYSRYIKILISTKQCITQ